MPIFCNTEQSNMLYPHTNSLSKHTTFTGSRLKTLSHLSSTFHSASYAFTTNNWTPPTFTHYCLNRLTRSPVVPQATKYNTAYPSPNICPTIGYLTIINTLPKTTPVKVLMRLFYGTLPEPCYISTYITYKCLLD